MQIEKALIASTDRQHVSNVSWKFFTVSIVFSVCKQKFAAQELKNYSS